MAYPIDFEIQLGTQIENDGTGTVIGYLIRIVCNFSDDTTKVATSPVWLVSEGYRVSRNFIIILRTLWVVCRLHLKMVSLSIGLTNHA